MNKAIYYFHNHQEWEVTRKPLEERGSESRLSAARYRNRPLACPSQVHLVVLTSEVSQHSRMPKRYDE